MAVSHIYCIDPTGARWPIAQPGGDANTELIAAMHETLLRGSRSSTSCAP